MKHNYFRGCAAAISIIGVPMAAGAQGAITNNAFNPALSVIVDGKYAHYSRDASGIPGFLLGGEGGLAPKGLSLGESEIAASANVDNRFYGQVTIALASDDDATEVALEEAFVQTTSLPAGLTLKAGRFFSEIGYLNSKHAHAWDFVDQPLAYKAMLGNQYGDDGVQVRWIAPTDLLVETGAEVFRGANFPAGGATHGGIGAWTVFAHVGGDIGTSQSWRAGVSYLNSDAAERKSLVDNGDTVAFTGSSDVVIGDFVWKWAERGNPKSRNLVVQGEYLRRKERGSVVDLDIDYGSTLFPLLTAPISFDYRGIQQGFYLQAAYQFMPRWRVGVRYDRLRADNSGPNIGVPTPLEEIGHDPSRVTAMLDFANSEFARLRFQVAADKSQRQTDNQLTLQYVMSIGAHGAHQF